MSPLDTPNIQAPGPSPQTLAPLAERAKAFSSEGRGFDDALNQAQMSAKQNPLETSPQTNPLRNQVRKLVSTAFITPLFAQLRQGSGFAEGTPFAPGSAENSFHQMLDQMLADRMVSQMDNAPGGMPLIHQLTEHLGRDAYHRASALDPSTQPPRKPVVPHQSVSKQSVPSPAAAPKALDQHA